MPFNRDDIVDAMYYGLLHGANPFVMPHDTGVIKINCSA